jgi:hypothetical protein
MLAIPDGRGVMSVGSVGSRLDGRWKVGSTTAVAILLVVATLFIALPAGAQGDIHVFTGPPGTHKFFDFGRPGLRIGDRLVARGALLNETQESEVGSFSMDCVVVRAITDDPSGPGGVYRCSYLLHLEEGDLILEGLDPHGPGVYTFAVLGGTEAYAGATGDATLTDFADATEFVINLI